MQCRACGMMQGTSPNRNQRMKRWMWHEKGIRKFSTRDYNNKTRRLAHSSWSAVMVILSQNGFGITRARSGNWDASLGSLLPLLSSAKEHSQTGPPGPRMWHVQSDTWTSQWCTFYHTSLLQRAAFLTGLPQLHYHEAKEEPVKRDDTLVAPIRGCSRSA